MNNFNLRKAERKQAKLRIGLSGPSGSGKTYGSLKIARGITEWDKIVIIDTENKSADLFSDLGDYNVMTLEAPFSPENYIAAIEACENQGMEVIIIDSVSHEWDGKGGCLESNDLLAEAKFRGNTWAAWSKTTPRHRQFIERIIASPCHIITTVRNKQETIQTEQKKIKKVGMKEVQREGFEYELTLNFNIDRDGHHATASKDRTGIFETMDPFVITEATGELLFKWNNSGTVNTFEQKREIMRQLKRIGFDTENDSKEQVVANVLDLTKLSLEEKNFDKIIKKLKTVKPIETGNENKEEDIPFDDEDGPITDTQEPEMPPEEEEKPEPPIKTQKTVKKPVAPKKAVAPKKKTAPKVNAMDQARKKVLETLRFKRDKKNIDIITAYNRILERIENGGDLIEEEELFILELDEFKYKTGDEYRNNFKEVFANKENQ